MSDPVLTPALSVVWSAAWAVAFLAAALLLSFLPTSADADAHCRVQGGSRDRIVCNLGLELWEDGEKSQTIFQQWRLTCDSGSRPKCTLERTYLTLRLPVYPGDVTSMIFRHSSDTGTLRVITVDIKAGLLEFNVIYSGGEEMPVVIRLAPPINIGATLFRDVETFQAKHVLRSMLSGRLAFQEWRIPDYTHTVNVPFVVWGKKSAAEQERDKFVSSLSPSDQLAFRRVQSGTCLDFGAWFQQDPLRQIAQPYEAELDELDRSETEAIRAGDLKRLVDVRIRRDNIWSELMSRDDVQKSLRDPIEKCLAEAGMSQEGRRAIANETLRALRSSGRR